MKLELPTSTPNPAPACSKTPSCYTSYSDLHETTLLFQQRTSDLIPAVNGPSTTGHAISVQPDYSNYSYRNDRIINDLVASLFEHSLDIQSFIQSLKNSGFSISDPAIFSSILSYKETNLKIIGSLLLKLTEDEIPDSLTKIIADWLFTLNKHDLFDLLLKRGKHCTQYHGIYSKDFYTLSNQHFVPLFLLNDFAGVSFSLVQKLMETNKFHWVYRLLFANNQEDKKWISTSSGIIESIPLLKYISSNYPQTPNIRALFNTPFKIFLGYSLTLENIVNICGAFDELKERLDGADSDHLIIEILIENLKSDQKIILNPLIMYFLTPLLKRLTLEGKPQTLNLVENLLMTNLSEESILLQDCVYFELALPLLDALIEAKHWNLVDKLLTANSPCLSKRNFNLSLPLIDKILDNGQFELIKNWLLTCDDRGNNLIHYNLPQVLPTLIKLLNFGQYNLVANLLSTPNNFEHTPLYMYHNIFELCKELFDRLKHKPEILWQILFHIDDAGLTPIHYNFLQDTILCKELLMELINARYYDFVKHFLSIKSNEGNTLLHNIHLFPFFLPVLQGLIAHNQFNILRGLLKTENSKGKNPLEITENKELLKELNFELENFPSSTCNEFYRWRAYQ